MPVATPSPNPATAPTGAKAGAKSAPQRALEKLGLSRDIDLALHLPLRYEDETRLTPMAALREGESAQVQGRVLEARIELRPRRQLLVRLADDSGELLLRFLNFYPSHQKTMLPGAWLRVSGQVRGGFLGREMVHPAFKVVDAGTPLASALTPVYPSVAQLPQAYLRKAVASALLRAPLAELLPAALLPPGLPTLQQALQWLHQPPADADQASLLERSHPAWQRLKFDELLAQQIAQRSARQQRAQRHAPALPVLADGLAQRLRAALPFALTAAQQRVGAEIAADLGRPLDPAAPGVAAPMHRLLQGDVGSGKTVVAALAAAVAIDAGWQCALMAPTEILAEQHFRKLVQWLGPLLPQGETAVAWLTGSRKGKARRQMVERVASGQASLVVGTQAVIQDDVQFARLGLAIIDEQHRFGVAQRLQLRRKLAGADGRAEGDPAAAAALEPHLLMMSATPIPRSLAMSYYADLDLSTLDELPPGRTPILTKLFAEDRRPQVIDRIRDELAQGRQVYWVCPLVEESEALDLQNATETHAKLVAALPGCEVGLLHGRMGGADKAAAMARFSAGQMALMVATTVIEVGVDVANASLMVVEHAERFGLAQLHQLRGRVGRGSAASVCVLLYGAALSAAGRQRLRAMAETQDGFEIARRDLLIRGPGEFMGARQSGQALLRFADLAGDAPLLALAQQAAEVLMRLHPQAAQAHQARWLERREEFLSA